MNNEKIKSDELAKKLKKVADDKLIEGEEYNADGHKLYFDQEVAKSAEEFNTSSVAYALRWGKLMQAEMKRQGLSVPTWQLVEDAQKRANIYGKYAAHYGATLLMATWKYGVEAADAMGYDADEAVLYRATRSDRAMEFYNKYKQTKPKDEDDAIKKNGQILATVLQDEALVEQFHKRVENGSKEIVEVEQMHSYIPILDIKKNDLYTLSESCNYAIAQIRTVKAKTVEKIISSPKIG